MADNNTNNLASGSAKLGAAATGLGNITNVQVAVRCRPVNGEERKTGQPVAITCQPESKSIQVSYGPAGKKTTKAYTFDKVLFSDD